MTRRQRGWLVALFCLVRPETGSAVGDSAGKDVLHRARAAFLEARPEASPWDQCQPQMVPTAQTSSETPSVDDYDIISRAEAMAVCHIDMESGERLTFIVAFDNVERTPENLTAEARPDQGSGMTAPDADAGMVTRAIEVDGHRFFVTTGTSGGGVGEVIVGQGPFYGFNSISAGIGTKEHLRLVRQWDFAALSAWQTR